jgi:hypothetical protein
MASFVSGEAMQKLSLIAAAALLAAPLAADAQSGSVYTYRCTSKDGKKYYGSTIPPQCYDRPVEQLNNQGLVVKRIDPEGDEKAKEEKEAALAKAKETEAANREDVRRGRALLATYTSERDIEDARRRALEDNEGAVREVEGKIDALKKKHQGYERDIALYKDPANKKGEVPARLTADLKNSEIDLKAQEELLAVKKKEVIVINAKYDDDKKRYIELTRGTSPSKSSASK